MKIRGERECKACGHRWSYYETGSVVCPSCGSMRSVGLDEREEHTDGASSLNLAAVRNLVDDAPLEDVASEAATQCREYVRKSGFVRGGDLESLDDTYLAAAELAEVGAHLERALRVSDEEEYHFLELLRGADRGERPDAEEVPESLWSARGLAYASALDAYRRDARRYLDENPNPVARRLLGTVDEHRKRVEALDGDVDPRSVEHLVRAVRDVGDALAAGGGEDGDEGEDALAAAQGRLDEFDLRV